MFGERLRDCSTNRSTTFSSLWRQEIGTATFLHCIERNNYNNKCYVDWCNRLWRHWVCCNSSSFIVIKILMISIIYVFMTLESHVHICEATNLFLIFFWIKMILTFHKFITITSIKNISLILFCAK